MPGILGEQWPPGFPSCIDWASGEDGLLGTPSSSDAVGRTREVVFEEHATSPEVERAEQATCVHRFSTDWDSGLLWLQTLGRGSILEDSFGNNTLVLANKLERRPGGMGELTVTAESVSFDLPPDEFQVEPVEFNPPIFYHPRYKSVVTYNLDSSGNRVDAALYTGFELIQFIRNATNNMQVEYLDHIEKYISATKVTDATVRSLATELLAKLRKGEDEFYMVGWKVMYTQTFWMAPFLNPGGYVEDPVLSGELPYYFWSIDRYNPASSPLLDNIFLGLGPWVNPDLYPPALGASAFSWFRLADHLSFQRTLFRKTKTWVAAPLGVWDTELYPSY